MGGAKEEIQMNEMWLRGGRTEDVGDPFHRPPNNLHALHAPLLPDPAISESALLYPRVKITVVTSPDDAMVGRPGVYQPRSVQGTVVQTCYPWC